ncbi:MAG: hypothetical protein JXR70_01565 [Spirochaetales bacterium]|nr:hypothetical protein [Spirochaetales bacterium]
MIERTFQHNDANYISNYMIWRDKDIIFIDNYYCGRNVKTPTKRKFFMHIANVLKILKAIIFVFKTSSGRGESQHIIQNKEDITPHSAVNLGNFLNYLELRICDLQNRLFYFSII